jgi:hypothetical protein
LRRPSPLNLIWFAFGALLIQILVVSVSQGPAIRILLPLSTVLIIPFLIANWRYAGIRLMAAGVLLNLLVMLANGGLMPVTPGTVDAVGRVDISSLVEGENIPHSKNVMLKAEDARFPRLGDAIVLPIPHPFTRAVSPGDILLVLGLAVAGAEFALRLNDVSPPFTERCSGDPNNREPPGLSPARPLPANRQH